MALGQAKGDGKTNEIKALPGLLKLLDIAGCIVTADAMGCQKAIARQIVEQKGDYVLALKGNQTSLHADVKLFFEDAIAHDFASLLKKERSSKRGVKARAKKVLAG